jgi:hypothetical protein
MICAIITQKNSQPVRFLISSMCCRAEALRYDLVAQPFRAAVNRSKFS